MVEGKRKEEKGTEGMEKGEGKERREEEGGITSNSWQWHTATTKSNNA